MAKDPNKYPKGWNRKKVEAIIAHYENQTEEEAVAEDEAAFGEQGTTVIEIPTRLVDRVLAMVAKESKKGATTRRRKSA